MRFLFLIGVFFIYQSLQAQSFELYAASESVVINGTTINPSDTINKKDANSKKQGIWIRTDKKTGKKINEGKYINNKKVGIWNKYYSSGNLKSNITYISGQPDGYAKIYYDNGKLEEEGIWKGDKWVGEYKYYYANGNPCYAWKYNEKGERSGQQKYFHENGKVKIEGKWDAGKEQGVVKEYHEDGSIKSEKTFNNGSMDNNTVKTFEKKETAVVVEKQPEDDNKTTNETNNTTDKKTNNSSKNLTTFTGNGYHKLFHPVHRKIQKEGEFVNGKLHTGKHYLYDDDGNLVRMLEYEEGSRIQDVKYNK